MAKFLTSTSSLAVGENKANDKESADAVSAEDQKYSEVTEIVKITEFKINKLLERSRSDLTEIKMKIGVTETKIEELLARNRSLKVMAVGENKANDKESADAVAGDDQKEFPNGDTVIVSKILPAYRRLEKFLKLMDDLERRLDVAEKNTKDLSKSVKEQSSRLRPLQYPADLSKTSSTGSQTLGMVTGLTAFGFGGLVAGILVSLLTGNRR